MADRCVGTNHIQHIRGLRDEIQGGLLLPSWFHCVNDRNDSFDPPSSAVLGGIDAIPAYPVTARDFDRFSRLIFIARSVSGKYVLCLAAMPIVAGQANAEEH